MVQSYAEQSLMNGLHAQFMRPNVAQFLAGMTHSLREQLARDSVHNMTFAAVPPDIFESKWPAEIRSSWVFVLRSGARFAAERHPNSIQRMFAFDGSGITQTWIDGGWRSHNLASNLSHEGLSIPRATWHRSHATGCDWSIVSFHTATADDLIEELGDPELDTSISRHKYSEGASQ